MKGAWVRWIFVLLMATVTIFPPIAVGQANTLIVGVDADLLATDPAQSVRHRVSDLIYSFLYPTLYQPYPGPEGEYLPGLALTAERISSRRWEIELTVGHRLSSGVPIDASLLAAILTQLVDPEANAGLPVYDRLQAIESVEVIDEYRIVINLHRTLNNLPTLLAKEWLPPPSGGGAAGPYRLERWDRGNRVILVAVDEKATPIYRIQFEVFTNVTRRLDALRSGQIHVAMSVPPERALELAAAEGIVVKATPGTRSYFLEFNTTRPPFHDPRVRLAVALALDIPAALNKAQGGFGLPTGTIFSPATFGHASDLPGYGYDPDRARELLAEAGYPNGFEIELDYLPHRAALAQVYAEMLEAVGIGVHLREWPNWTALRAALSQGDRMMWTSEWDNSSQEPSSILTAKVATGGSANYGGYSNPEVDDLLSAAQQAEDLETRVRLYQEVQRLLWDDVAMVPEYVEEEIFAVRSEYQDWEIPYRPSRVVFPQP